MDIRHVFARAWLIILPRFKKVMMEKILIIQIKLKTCQVFIHYIVHCANN